MSVARKAQKYTNAAALCACLLLAASTALLGQTSTGADRVAAPMMSEAAKAPAGQAPYVPMTHGQRRREYVKDTFNVLSLVTSGASAGIGQWRDRPREWQQGAAGYSRRFASSYAEHVVQETFMFGAASALHEDNRYVRSGQSGTGNRIKYAVASTFLARRDDGSRHFSFSRLAAFAGASMVSRLWQPESGRNFRGGAVNLGLSFSVAVGWNVAREFLPFIFRGK